MPRKPQEQTSDGSVDQTNTPNILMIMVDQMRFPPGFGSNEGFEPDLKEIFKFGKVNDKNLYAQHFPGFMDLRKNAVILKNHRIASSACVPSRTAIFTGQYGTQTTATQTDGIFKDGADKDFPWLKERTVPTIGDWMEKYGYDTHYFGKWHISGERTEDLTGYGFKDWELSYPNPHGTLPNNLGYYRDHQFVDLVTSFLRRQGLAVPFDKAHAQHNAHPDQYPEPDNKKSPAPWFAVASFTNPHDIAGYPGLPSQVCDQRLKDADGDISFTLAVPKKNTKATPPSPGTMEIVLNKTGFPQNNALNSPTWDEDLVSSNKPDCQFDYAHKFSLALTSGIGLAVAKAYAESAPDNTEELIKKQLNIASDVCLQTDVTGMPFALTSNPELSCLSYMQYYGYLMSEVDQHIKATLDALTESGQADNTIVIFCPDHGEYGGSHGKMMDKWHTGYEEVLHVPMVVRFPEKLYNVDRIGNSGLKEIGNPTSHIDILPTILGLAGIDTTQKGEIKSALKEKHSRVLDPVGSDLSGLIKGSDTEVKNTDGRERDGTFFMTYDTITEPLYPSRGHNPKAKEEKEEAGITDFMVYKTTVAKLIEGNTEHGPIDLGPGPVKQPNYVHCFVDNAHWKLVRYFDGTTGIRGYQHEADQYELYNLNQDPAEQWNLLVYTSLPGDFVVAASLPTWATSANDSSAAQILSKADTLRQYMEESETNLLYPSEPSAIPAPT